MVIWWGPRLAGGEALTGMPPFHVEPRAASEGRCEDPLTVPAPCSARRARFEHHRDPGRPRPLGSGRRAASPRCQRLAHDPGRNARPVGSILTQPVNVLIDRAALNFAHSAVTIPELRDRPLGTGVAGGSNARGQAAGPRNSFCRTADNIFGAVRATASATPVSERIASVAFSEEPQC